MFIEAFHYSEDAGNILEVYLTNLKIARQRIIEFKMYVPPFPPAGCQKIEDL